MKKVVFFSAGLLFTLVLLAVGLYHLINAEKFQVTGEIIASVNTQQKVVALTFDDGPNEHTEIILNALKEKQVPATFYLIGQEIEKHPKEAATLVAAGHQLGNHSYSHQRMVLKSSDFLAEEIEKTNQLIRNASYSGEITFRPPYGKKLVGLPHYLKSKNIKTVTWNIEPVKALGGNASTGQIVTYVVQKTRPGSIILLHPWYGEQNASREAIPLIIDQLQSSGYTFVTVDELLKSESSL